jgi:hypothetical protein
MALDRRIEQRAAALASDPHLSAAEIHRRIRSGSDGGEPIRIGYEPVRRAVARLRWERRPIGEETPAGLAARILTALDREMRRIEDRRGSVDLDRLDRIAATLRRIEPIRPKAEGKERSSLRSLLPKGEPQTEGEPTEGEDPIGANGSEPWP